MEITKEFGQIIVRFNDKKDLEKNLTKAVSKLGDIILFDEEKKDKNCCSDYNCNNCEYDCGG